MKYHIKNKISKRELRKQGKNILPLMNNNITATSHPFKIKLDVSKHTIVERKNEH